MFKSSYVLPFPHALSELGDHGDTILLSFGLSRNQSFSIIRLGASLNPTSAQHHPSYPLSTTPNSTKKSSCSLMVDHQLWQNWRDGLLTARSPINMRALTTLTKPSASILQSLDEIRFVSGHRQPSFSELLFQLNHLAFSKRNLLVGFGRWVGCDVG